MTGEGSRGLGAGVIAALIAVPLAVVAGIGSFVLLRPEPEPSAQPTATAASSTLPTTPVEVPTRNLDDRQELVCRGFVAQLPGQVSDLRRRVVSGGYEQNAAYGEPPVTVACGGDRAVVDPAATVYRLDGVCWIADPAPDGTVFTTVDREVPVRVSVPSAYDPPGQVVVGFGDTIAATVRSSDAAPTGCAPN